MTGDPGRPDRRRHDDYKFDHSSYGKILLVVLASIVLAAAVVLDVLFVYGASRFSKCCYSVLPPSCPQVNHSAQCDFQQSIIDDRKTLTEGRIIYPPTLKTAAGTDITFTVVVDAGSLAVGRVVFSPKGDPKDTTGSTAVGGVIAIHALASDSSVELVSSQPGAVAVFQGDAPASFEFRVHATKAGTFTLALSSTVYDQYSKVPLAVKDGFDIALEVDPAPVDKSHESFWKWVPETLSVVKDVLDSVKGIVLAIAAVVGVVVGWRRWLRTKRQRAERGNTPRRKNIKRSGP